MVVPLRVVIGTVPLHYDPISTGNNQVNGNDQNPDTMMNIPMPIASALPEHVDPSPTACMYLALTSININTNTNTISNTSTNTKYIECIQTPIHVRTLHVIIEIYFTI